MEDLQQVPVLLRRELGEAVTVRRVSLLENGFIAEVRDPQKRQNLDRYTYFYDKWDVEPVMVSQSDIDELDETTFGLGAVDWSVIPGWNGRRWTHWILRTKR